MENRRSEAKEAEGGRAGERRNLAQYIASRRKTVSQTHAGHQRVILRHIIQPLRQCT